MVTKSANECACGLVGTQTLQEEKCSKTGICLSSQVLFATKYTLVHSRLTQRQLPSVVCNKVYACAFKIDSASGWNSCSVHIRSTTMQRKWCLEWNQLQLRSMIT